MNNSKNTSLKEVLQKGIRYPINLDYRSSDGASVVILVARGTKIQKIGSYLVIWEKLFNTPGIVNDNYALAIRLASMCQSYLMGNREEAPFMYWEKDKSEWNAQVK